MSRRSLAASILAAAFFAGVAATLGVSRIVDHQRDADSDAFFRAEHQDRRPTRPPGERPDAIRQSQRWTELARLRVTERLINRLDLREEQLEGVMEAMDRSQSDAQEVWDDILPVLASQRDSLEAELGRILTPEQHVIFLTFLKADHERVLRGRNSRRPRGGGGPPR